MTQEQIDNMTDEEFDAYLDALHEELEEKNQSTEVDGDLDLYIGKSL